MARKNDRISEIKALLADPYAQDSRLQTQLLLIEWIELAEERIAELEEEALRLDPDCQECSGTGRKGNQVCGCAKKRGRKR